MKITHLILSILLILLACSNKHQDEKALHTRDILKCIIQEIEQETEVKTPAIDEFYELNTNRIYVTYLDEATIINNFILVQGFNKPNNWTQPKNKGDIDDNMYDIVVRVDSNTQKRVRYKGLNVFIYQPTKTDSCYYIHARYETAMVTTNVHAPYREGIICKFDLQKNLLSYFRYAGLE